MDLLFTSYWKIEKVAGILYQFKINTLHNKIDKIILYPIPAKCIKARQ
jgi:hypothetical protein